MTARDLFVLAAVTAGVVGLAPAASADPAYGPQLRADTPVFLANIDDDANACKAPAKKIAADAVPREQANEGAFNKRHQELIELQKTDPVRAEKEYAELQRTHRLQQYQAARGR
jgi:protein-arginine deiminase